MAHALPPHVARTLEGYLVDCWRNSDAPRNQHRALVISLGLHALRTQEICNLLIRHFDPAGSTLKVVSVKGGLARTVSLDPAFAAAISGTLSRRKGPKLRNHHLFITTSTRPMLTENVHAMVRRLCLQLDIAFTMHSLRHTSAVRCWLATHDVLAVMRLLGHRTMQVTHRYLATITEVPPHAFPQWRLIRPDLTDLKVLYPPGWNFKASSGPHPRWGA